MSIPDFDRILDTSRHLLTPVSNVHRKAFCVTCNAFVTEAYESACDHPDGCACAHALGFFRCPMCGYCFDSLGNELPDDIQPSDCNEALCNDCMNEIADADYLKGLSSASVSSPTGAGVGDSGGVLGLPVLIV